MNKHLFDTYYLLESFLRGLKWRVLYGVTLSSRYETLYRVVTERKSLVRLGDGECLMMFEGSNIYFQDNDPLLKAKLIELVANASHQLEIAFNNEFTTHTHWPVVRKYERSNKEYARYVSASTTEDIGLLGRHKQRRRYEEFLKQLLQSSSRRILGEATLFFVGHYYHLYKRGELVKVYQLYKKLFEQKRVLIVCPQDPVLPPSFKDMVDKGVITSASSIQFIYIPSQNAFEQYSSILDSIKVYRDKVDIVLIQAGPLAKVLVYDLSTQDGMWAVDVGSLNVSMYKAFTEDNFVF